MEGSRVKDITTFDHFMYQIVNSKFSRKRFHIFSRISYSTTYSSFNSYVSLLVSDASFTARIVLGLMGLKIQVLGP